MDKTLVWLGECTVRIGGTNVVAGLGQAEGRPGVREPPAREGARRVLARAEVAAALADEDGQDVARLDGEEAAREAAGPAGRLVLGGGPVAWTGGRAGRRGEEATKL